VISDYRQKKRFFLQFSDLVNQIDLLKVQLIAELKELFFFFNRKCAPTELCASTGKRQICRFAYVVMAASLTLSVLKNARVVASITLLVLENDRVAGSHTLMMPGAKFNLKFNN